MKSPVLIILIIISLLAVSCSMPDAGESNPLIGSWILSAQGGSTHIFTFTSNTIKYDITTGGMTVSGTCNYAYNDTVGFTMYTCSGNTDATNLLLQFNTSTYSIADNILTLTVGVGTNVFTRI